MKALTYILVVCGAALFAVGALAQPQWQPQVIWQRQGATDSSLYGYSILALGDQNGDGFNDWAVLSEGNANSTWHGTQRACLEFFHGGNPPSTTPYMVRQPDTLTERSFWQSHTVGDLNGDGYIDWIILVELIGTPARYAWDLYFGGPGLHAEPDMVWRRVPWSAYYGIGDFDGDRFDDLLLTNSSADTSVVYYGGSAMDTIPDWRCSTYLICRGPADVNGDGVADIVSGDTQPSSHLEIYFGGSTPDTTPAYSFFGWGDNPFPLGDLNADGFEDYGLPRGPGVEVHLGAMVPHAAPDVSMNEHCTGGGFLDLWAVGDINHDHYGDFVGTSHWCDNAWFGLASLYLGSALPLRTEPVWTVIGWTDPLNLIGLRCAVGLGDVNDDGVDDFAIGSNDDLPYLGWRGKAVVLSGDSTLPITVLPRTKVPDQLALSVYPNPFNSSTTLELHAPVHAQQAELVVFNLLGQTVFRATVPVDGGQSVYRYDARGLATGLYLLRVSVGSLHATFKLMVLK